MSNNKLSSKDIKKIGDAVDAMPSGTMNGIFNASKKEIDPVGLAINAFSEAFKSSQPSPKPPTVTISREWLPTPKNINALPEPVRSYIADIETRSDPQYTMQENVFLKDQVRQLEHKLQKCKSAIEALEQSEWIEISSGKFPEFCQLVNIQRLSGEVESVYWANAMHVINGQGKPYSIIRWQPITPPPAEVET